MRDGDERPWRGECIRAPSLWRKAAFVLRASVILVMKTFQLAWLAARFAFLGQDRGMQFGASVQQIILLVYYTTIAQTGWNIEQSEEINQPQEEKAKSPKEPSLFTRTYTHHQHVQRVCVLTYTDAYIHSVYKNTHTHIY